MKTISFFFLLLIIPCVFLGAGVMKKDLAKTALTGLSPTIYGVYSTTKADVTINTTTYSRIKIYPVTANDVTMKINGTGTGWPFTKNTKEEYGIPSGVTSLVFSVTSTASTAKSKIYYQAEE